MYFLLSKNLLRIDKLNFGQSILYIAKYIISPLIRHHWPTTGLELWVFLVSQIVSHLSCFLWLIVHISNAARPFKIYSFWLEAGRITWENFRCHKENCNNGTSGILRFKLKLFIQISLLLPALLSFLPWGLLERGLIRVGKYWTFPR